MELEFFCEPGTDLEWFAYWKKYCINWLKALGIKEDEMRARDHSQEELCFYSKATTDLEFLFPFGWGELWGYRRQNRLRSDSASEHPDRI